MTVFDPSKEFCTFLESGSRCTPKSPWFRSYIPESVFWKFTLESWIMTTQSLFRQIQGVQGVPVGTLHIPSLGLSKLTRVRREHGTHIHGRLPLTGNPLKPRLPLLVPLNLKQRNVANMVGTQLVHLLLMLAKVRALEQVLGSPSAFSRPLALLANTAPS